MVRSNVQIYNRSTFIASKVLKPIQTVFESQRDPLLLTKKGGNTAVSDLFGIRP